MTTVNTGSHTDKKTKREWAGLSDEEVQKIYRDNMTKSISEIISIVQAKLKEINHALCI